jgi:hypothetical protein
MNSVFEESSMSSLIHAARPISAAILLILLSACFENTPIDSGVKAPLLTELRAINGEYQWNDELKRFIYSEKSLIEKILATREPELAVSALVNCLDDLALTSSTLGGKRLVTGVVCYEALSQTIYYEPTSQEGDIERKWPGHILPTATPDEIKEAKLAWKEVLDSKSYMFL